MTTTQAKDFNEGPVYNRAKKSGRNIRQEQQEDVLKWCSVACWCSDNGIRQKAINGTS